MKVSGKLAEKGLHAFDGEPRHHAGIEVPRLWIVVADREKAHIYRKAPNGIERIADARIGHGHSNHETTVSGGASYHGHDPRIEKAHHNEGAFIRKLTAWIDLASKEKVFDRLVLVAAPHTLGDIRAYLGAGLHNLVAAEVNKDLIKMSEKEIEDHLAKIVWF